MARLVDISRQLLNLQVVEALMHKKVNSDHLVKLIHSQPPDRFENAEEDRAENRGPGNDDQASESLHLKLLETTRVDQAKVFVKDAHC